MEVLEAIAARKSIRGFAPDPVPVEILRGVLEAATHAPSAMNSQPWEFYVLGGEVLASVKRANAEKLNAGIPPNPEHLVVGWGPDSVYRNRQVALAKQIFQLMDISRDDAAGRAQWLQRGFRFFDAPAAVVIVVDSSLREGAPLLDIGAVMQSICLAALTYGLGTCIEDQGVMYPDVIREFTGMPESKRIVISIAIGYPDGQFAANRVDSAREPLDGISTWCGFA